MELPKAHLIVDAVGSPPHAIAIFSILICIAGTHIPSNYQNPHFGYLTCGVRTITVEKSIGLSLPK